MFIAVRLSFPQRLSEFIYSLHTLNQRYQVVKIKKQKSLNTKKEKNVYIIYIYAYNKQQLQIQLHY